MITYTIVANITSREDRMRPCGTNVPSYFLESRKIYIGPEHHSSLYLLIASDSLISVFALFCGLLVRIALHQNIMDLAGHSGHTHWSFSVSLALLVAAQELRAPGGLFKTPSELCVEANENTLKVNGPLGLSSPSYWLPVGAMTLLLHSEYHSHSPSSFTG